MEAAAIAAVVSAGGKATSDVISASKQGGQQAISGTPPLPDFSGFFDDDELMALLSKQGMGGPGGF